MACHCNNSLMHSLKVVASPPAFQFRAYMYLCISCQKGCCLLCSASRWLPVGQLMLSALTRPGLASSMSVNRDMMLRCRSATWWQYALQSCTQQATYSLCIPGSTHCRYTCRTRTTQRQRCVAGTCNSQKLARVLLVQYKCKTACSAATHQLAVVTLQLLPAADVGEHRDEQPAKIKVVGHCLWC